MAHRLTEIYIHIVFATKFREPYITEEYREPLQRYLGGIYAMRKHGLLAHYAMPDHYHALIRYHPSDLIADLIKALKNSSNTWLNQNPRFGGMFAWQTGYGAFSHTPGDLDAVIAYIHKQPEHHTSLSLEEEVQVLNRRYQTNWVLEN